MIQDDGHETMVAKMLGLIKYFNITRMQAQRIGLTTALNTIPIYTMKPIVLHMQVYGTSLGFSLNKNARFYIFSSNLLLFEN